MHACEHECRHQGQPEENVRSPEVGVTGSCEPLNVCARNRTLALHNSACP